MSYALGVLAAKKEEERERKALRDHFAGLAMQAYCSDPKWRFDTDPHTTAACAYVMANAMLAEREKGDE